MRGVSATDRMNAGLRRPPRALARKMLRWNTSHAAAPRPRLTSRPREPAAEPLPELGSPGRCRTPHRHVEPREAPRTELPGRQGGRRTMNPDIGPQGCPGEPDPCKPGGRRLDPLARSAETGREASRGLTRPVRGLCEGCREAAGRSHRGPEGSRSVPGGRCDRRGGRPAGSRRSQDGRPAGSRRSQDRGRWEGRGGGTAGSRRSQDGGRWEGRNGRTAGSRRSQDRGRWEGRGGGTAGSRRSVARPTQVGRVGAVRAAWSSARARCRRPRTSRRGRRSRGAGRSRTRRVGWPG